MNKYFMYIHESYKRKYHWGISFSYGKEVPERWIEISKYDYGRLTRKYRSGIGGAIDRSNEPDCMMDIDEITSLLTKIGLPEYLL